MPKFDLILLGRIIGKYEDTDIYPEDGVLVLAFEPGENCRVPAGNIYFNFGDGQARIQGAVDGVDIIEAIAACPRATPEDITRVDNEIDAIEAFEEGSV